MKLIAFPVRRMAISMMVLAIAVRSTHLLQSARAADATTAPAPAAQESAVEIDNFVFKPQNLSISVGTKVTWTNKDDVPHTATSSDTPPQFDSKTLDTDGKFSFTFTKPGTFKYYCKVHPHMTGTITVK
jgi:plastocyanin